MKPVVSVVRRNVVAVALLLIPGAVAAHDIPASVVVQSFVRPQGERLRLLVRVPLGAMRDVEFPLKGDGLLDLLRADRSLRDAATLWIAKDLPVYEGDTPLGAPTVANLRVSLPSDRSFVTFESAEKITIRTLAAQEVSINVADITSRTKLPQSMMPPGLVDQLTMREFASLLDYLEALAKK